MLVLLYYLIYSDRKYIEREERGDSDLGPRIGGGKFIFILGNKHLLFSDCNNKRLEFSENFFFPKLTIAKGKFYKNSFSFQMPVQKTMLQQNIFCFPVHSEQDEQKPISTKGDICKFLENIELRDDQLQPFLTRIHKKVSQTREGKEQILWQDCKCRQDCSLWEL